MTLRLARTVCFAIILFLFLLGSGLLGSLRPRITFLRFECSRLFRCTALERLFLALVSFLTGLIVSLLRNRALGFAGATSVEALDSRLLKDI